MYYIRKLKRQKFNKGLLVPFIILPPFFILLKVLGLQMAYLFLTPVIFLGGLYSFLSYMRTRNMGFLFGSIVMSLAVLMCIVVFIYGSNMPKVMILPLLILILMTLPVLIYITFTKRNKWRLREILELAAVPVTDIEKGFSERPYPVGRVDFTDIELDGFNYFVKRNLIAIPVHDQDRVAFVINQDLNFILGFDNSYINKTFVLFEKDGRVLAHISKRDYLRYRDNFAYDQLCNSLGNLFIDFFDRYKKGEAIVIIDQLNDLDFNPITDN